MIIYLQLGLATLFNLGTVYFLKKANGFTVLWPTVLCLVTICLTQWLQSRAMANGMDIGLAVTTVVVSVMVGASFMGLWIFHETLSFQKINGLSIAVVGVVIASIAKTQN